MAPRKKKAPAKSKGPKVKKDSDGNPDIYDLVVNHGMGRAEACEHAGVGVAKGHTLLWNQEVEHNPDFAISTKGNEQAVGKRLAKARKSGLRWEQLAARSGLSVAKVRELIAEVEGVDVDDLKRKPGKKKKASSKKKGAPKKGRKKKDPEPEPEDDEEDEEEPEDEEVEDEDEADEDDSDEDEEEDDEDEDDDDDEDEEDDEEDPPAPRRRRRRRKKE